MIAREAGVAPVVETLMRHRGRATKEEAIRLEPYPSRPSSSLTASLLGRLRALWYRVVARSGIEHIKTQQELINQLYLDRLEWHEQVQLSLNDNQAGLSQQQALISERQQRYVEGIEQQLIELAAENALLLREIAALRQLVEKDKEENQVGRADS
jgi:hypothetical protein